jgi:signal peptidase I
MNGDRDARGQEVSSSDGYTRPGQVGDQHFDPVPGDGVTAPLSSAGEFPATSPADGTQADAPPGNPANGPAGSPANGPAGSPANGPPGNSVNGPGGGPAGSVGETAGVPRMTSPADGPGAVAGDAQDGGGDGDTGAIPEVSGRKRRRRNRRKSMSWWIELPILLVFALVLALLIKSFVVQAFYIPSSSMENTLEIGDKVLVNKLIYDFRPIHRGDIVVFNGDGSWEPTPAQASPPLTRLWNSISGLFGTAPGVHDFIKRVIGVPGDHVACCNAHGQVTVNGVPLSEKSYLYPGNVPSAMRFNIIVPPGRLWVMGDHRAVSWDSRGHMSDPGDGTIPENHVVGRAFVIVAPVSRWRMLPIPATFEQPKLSAAPSAALAANPATAGVNMLRLSGGSALNALALPGAPAAAGLVAAVPFTLLQRRLRRRLAARRRGQDGPEGPGGPGRARGPGAG